MGAGLHGGFGNTRGRTYKKANTTFNNTNYQTVNIHYSRESLISELEGVTKISNDVADALKKSIIKINVLGDKLFENYLGVDKKVKAMQIGNQLYLRNSSLSIHSDLVHEGNHALEYLAGVPAEIVGGWEGEIRAYKAEREFQIRTNRPLEFVNEDDIKVHVWMNYPRRAKK